VTLWEWLGMGSAIRPRGVELSTLRLKGVAAPATRMISFIVCPSNALSRRHIGVIARLLSLAFAML
jgi:hypothetical protein